MYLDGTKEPGYFSAEVANMLVARVGHRKVPTKAELREIIHESARGLPSLRV